MSEIEKLLDILKARGVKSINISLDFGDSNGPNDPGISGGPNDSEVSNDPEVEEIMEIPEEMLMGSF